MMERVRMEILLVYTYIMKNFFNIVYARTVCMQEYIFIHTYIHTYIEYISKFSHLVETE